MGILSPTTWAPRKRGEAIKDKGQATKVRFWRNIYLTWKFTVPSIPKWYHASDIASHIWNNVSDAIGNHHLKKGKHRLTTLNDRWGFQDTEVLKESLDRRDHGCNFWRYSRCRDGKTVNNHIYINNIENILVRIIKRIKTTLKGLFTIQNKDRNKASIV